MFAWRNAALVNRTRQIGPETCVPFREIAADSGGSTSCDTQPNCRTSFNMATALWSSPFFRLFAWLFFNLPVREWALCAELTSRFSFRELTFGELEILTTLFGASTFQIFSCLASKFRNRSFWSLLLFTTPAGGASWTCTGAGGRRYMMYRRQGWLIHVYRPAAANDPFSEYPFAVRPMPVCSRSTNRKGQVGSRCSSCSRRARCQRSHQLQCARRLQLE